MYDFLATQIINGVVDELVDIRQYATDFPWLNRLGIKPAMDGEIFARYKGRIYAADIIALDGKAVLRTLPSVRTTQSELPVLKHGAGFTREMLRLLARIESGTASVADRGIFANYTAEEMQNLIKGVYTRMEALSVAMVRDGGASGYTYNKLGIQLTNVTWGMPSDLKITNAGASLWSAASTATPVTDIQTILTLGRTKYGITFDRLSMGLQLFTQMITTAQFQQMARAIQYFGAPNVPLPLGNVSLMLPLAATILGVAEIEINDNQFWFELSDGGEGASRYQPANEVIFSCKQFDGKKTAYDFANAECEEAMPGMAPGIIGGFDGTEGDMRGPLGYATAASMDANPPGLNLWAVASGFPRKHREASTALLIAA